MDIKILVVEDEVSTNDILTTALKVDGYIYTENDVVVKVKGQYTP